MVSSTVLAKSKRRFHVSFGIDLLWCSWRRMELRGERKRGGAGRRREQKRG